jgi:hypothetical protein
METNWRFGNKAPSFCSIWATERWYLKSERDAFALVKLVYHIDWYYGVKHNFNENNSKGNVSGSLNGRVSKCVTD